MDGDCLDHRPSQVGRSSPEADLTRASDHESYAVTKGGRVLARGYNVFGQLGSGMAPAATSPQALAPS